MIITNKDDREASKILEYTIDDKILTIHHQNMDFINWLHQDPFIKGPVSIQFLVVDTNCESNRTYSIAAEFLDESTHVKILQIATCLNMAIEEYLKKHSDTIEWVTPIEYFTHIDQSSFRFEYIACLEAIGLHCGDFILTKDYVGKIDEVRRVLGYNITGDKLYVTSNTSENIVTLDNFTENKNKTIFRTEPTEVDAKKKICVKRCF